MSDDKKEAPILDHGYDGITEYDNPLPTWWLVTFFATIIFGFHYWVHYELGGGQTAKQELSEDLAKIKARQIAAPRSGGTEEELKKLAGVASVIATGNSTFQAKCAVCHGQDLQGIIGPNLTDNFWLHGKGTLSDISGVVRAGVLDKGMPSWENQLKNEEINAVVVFVASKRGSNPPNAKAPQGEKVE